MYKTLLVYLLIINLTGFITMFIDKSRAIHNEWRISEKNLMLISIIGGSVGMFIGMQVFRHKTKHFKFTFGIPFIFIIQILIAIYLCK